MTVPTPTVQRIWSCLACPDQPRFTHGEMRAHLAVHQLDDRTPAVKRMLAHLDGEEETITIYGWTFPNGVELRQTIVAERTGDNARQWQRGRRR